MRAYVLGAAVWGPGLAGWEASRPILAGVADHVPRETPPPAPALLAPTERRRTSLAVRLALQVAQEATAMSGLPADRLRHVFATSNGDGAVVHAILDQLAAGDHQVSPTLFHNSVHNAASGYWTIATRSHRPVTCLGCHDATTAAAILKAMAEVQVECQPVLLCLYDAPMPPPLDAKRPTTSAFAAGLVLAPEDDGRALARLDVRYLAAPMPPGTDAPDQASLCDLAAGNAAAQSLRLLQALARGAAGTASAPYLDGYVEMRIEPCSDDGRSPP